LISFWLLIGFTADHILLLLTICTKKLL
jgi:hypothetical protein